jgi:hypothetical protein
MDKTKDNRGRLYMSITNIHSNNFRNFLLLSGICSSLLYPITDILAGSLYKGYSFNEQAVSELFAIGAPTSRIVVPLLTLCSVFLLAFAIGVWLSSDNKRSMYILAVMIAGNAINSLILWIFFPMHMRGDQKTFTDIMHIIFAINPFILGSSIFGIFIYRNWFRFYSIVTVLLQIISAIIAFSFVPLLVANQPTPWLGITERISQYGYQLWLLVLTILLLQKQSDKKLHSKQ